MRRLIVNADDFGYSRGVTDGIVEAHVGGIVTSTSLMVSRPAAGYAGELARGLAELSVGLHFEHEGSADLDDPAQLRRAFADQLGRFRALVGRDPTHVDSHHHAHRPRMDAFAALVAPLGVPLRFDGSVAYIGDFFAQSDAGVTVLELVRRPQLLRLLRTHVREGCAELACHPGRIAGGLRSSYAEPREVELATLTEPGLRAQIEALGVRLVSYRDWRR